jgi:hypothetical protein
MKLIRQPANSSLCGQSCVAMVLGVSLRKAILLTRRKGVTRISDLSRAMRKTRVEYKRFTRTAPPRSIVFVKWNSQKVGHWVVYFRGRIYDPQLESPTTLDKYRKYLRKKGGCIAGYFNTVR